MMNAKNTLSLLLLLTLSDLTSSDPTHKVKPKVNDEESAAPLPILPIPSAAQLEWQSGEMAMFLHFGPNTFTDSEWGSGTADPSTFNPTRLDAHQWARLARLAGFSRVLITAKHHDGFCLWPSNLTRYSVRSSPWRGGSGDVVGELAAAARSEGLGLGVYLSPWDRHEPSYGRTREYNQFYLAQMSELLTRYGEIMDVFLDGAKGEEEKDMDYLFDLWFEFIHQLQPKAVIFSDAGPDSRWIGNEAGIGSDTCWSLFNRSNAQVGVTYPYAGPGEPNGPDWVPAECDVSIRPGWFWHASESPKPARALLELYYETVGKNCLLMLNVPPNSSGLISPQDVRVLLEFSELRNSIFSQNLASEAIVTASSTRGRDRFSPYNVLEPGINNYWAPEESESEWVLSFELRESVSFNVFKIQEPIQMGQRIAEFRVEVVEEGDKKWKIVANGTTVGYQRMLRFPTVKSQFLRFVITKSRAEPLVSFVGVYMDRFSAVISSQYIRSVVNESRIDTM